MRITLKTALLLGALLGTNLVAVESVYAAPKKKSKPVVQKKLVKKASVASSEQLQESRRLAVQSSAALVIEQGGSEALYQKNADLVVPIASITKLMTAMVVLDSVPDLQAPITVTDEDVDYLRGSRSRLHVGSVITRETALLLALMSSENRAANALGRHYPGGLSAFVAAMNRKAASLGMKNSHFEDPTGLTSNNVSTAYDLAKMVGAAHQYPLIREFSTTSDAQVEVSGRVLDYRNTNPLVKSSTWDVGLSKTGYIHEAGKCLVMQARVADKPVVIVLLDSAGKLTRVGDANRIKRWMESASAARRHSARLIRARIKKGHGMPWPFALVQRLRLLARLAVAERLRNLLGGFLDLRNPFRAVPVGRRRDREAGDDDALVVAQRRGDAAQADLGFLVVEGQIVAADLVELLLQRRQAGQRVRRLARQAGALGVGAHVLRRVGGEEEFADRGQVQRRAAADQIDDADQRAAARRALGVDDFVVVADAEVDRLADALMQLLHEGKGDFADVDSRFDDVAELEQADAELVGAGVLSFDEARGGHRGEDAVRRRGVEPGGLGENLEARRFWRVGQHVEQRHHALDDLYGTFFCLLRDHGRPVEPSVLFCGRIPLRVPPDLLSDLLFNNPRRTVVRRNILPSCV